jgi:hypothetical protein
MSQNQTHTAARSLQNVLNRIAYEALRFRTLYQEQKYDPVRKNRSFLNVTRKDVPRPVPVESPPVRTRVLDPELASLRELNRLAHVFQDKRHTFEIYPDYRVPVQSVSLKVVHHPPTRAEMAELNRLARLVELLPPTVSPLHNSLPTLLDSSDKVCSSHIRALLRLRKQDKFHHAFPTTQIPPVSKVFGQPRVDKEFFNRCLSSKLSQLRSTYHVSKTPRGFAPLVSSWINCMLSVYHESKLPLHVRQSKARKAKKNLLLPTKPELEFTPAQEDSIVAPQPSTTDENPLRVDNSFSSLDLREIKSLVSQIRVRHQALNTPVLKSSSDQSRPKYSDSYEWCEFNPDYVKLFDLISAVPALNFPTPPDYKSSFQSLFVPTRLDAPASFQDFFSMFAKRPSDQRFFRLVNDYLSTF